MLQEYLVPDSHFWAGRDTITVPGKEYPIYKFNPNLIPENWVVVPNMCFKYPCGHYKLGADELGKYITATFETSSYRVGSGCFLKYDQAVRDWGLRLVMDWLQERREECITKSHFFFYAIQITRRDNTFYVYTDIAEELLLEA